METAKRIHAQNEAIGFVLPENLGLGKSLLRIYSPLPLATRATHHLALDCARLATHPRAHKLLILT